MIGNRFGRLVVVYRDGRSGNDAAWQCRCDCGKTRRVRADHLSSGATTSCGCYRRANLLSMVTKHARAGTPEYRAWKGMKTRCTNDREKGWKNYGGRGIRVCDRWLNSFEAFLADVGPRPSPQHSIDRFPDNDGNYEPGNVRWATRKQQSENRRKPSRKEGSHVVHG